VVNAIAHGPYYSPLEKLADEFAEELSLARVALYSKD
jgi:hypothetical protein